MGQQELISRINELPRIESVLQELLEMVNRDAVDFDELAKKMAMDQVLLARVLRLANSAQFGSVKGISNIHEAVIRVGVSPLRNLISSSIVAGSFPKIDTLDLKEYWSNCFEIAMIASAIAKDVDIDPNEAFTSGVLHNIGELMIHTLEPEIALEIQRRADNGEGIAKVQKELLDVDAQALGAALAETWKFPNRLVDAIAHVNCPSKAVSSKHLACLLYLARDIHLHWDEIEGDEGKQTFLAQSKPAQALNLSSDVAAEVDKVRGQGRELAAELA